MDCPVCKNVSLHMSERQGVEIDYCPQCRGVWLDRGELDKIIERSEDGGGASAAPSSGGHRPESFGYGEGHGRDQHYRKKKRKGFLSDLFEFD